MSECWPFHISHLITQNLSYPRRSQPHHINRSRASTMGSTFHHADTSFSARIARAQEREAQVFAMEKSRGVLTEPQSLLTEPRGVMTEPRRALMESRKGTKEPRRVLTIKGDAALELALRTGRVAREAREGRGGEEEEGAGRRRERGREKRAGEGGEGGRGERG